jgi:hypothetical protein
MGSVLFNRYFVTRNFTLMPACVRVTSRRTPADFHSRHRIDQQMDVIVEVRQ